MVFLVVFFIGCICFLGVIFYAFILITKKLLSGKSDSSQKDEVFNRKIEKLQRIGFKVWLGLLLIVIVFFVLDGVRLLVESSANR